jgi:hypothetical protein
MGETMPPMNAHALLVFGIIAVLWVLSLWWHPLHACKNCKGTGRFYGKVHTKKFHHCARCGNSGRAPRPGFVVLRAMGWKHSAGETGPGWAWRRRREARRR